MGFYSGKSLNDLKLIVAGNVYETDGHNMARDRKGRETDHRDHVDAKNIQAKLMFRNLRLVLSQNDFVTDYPLYATGRDKPQYYTIKNGLIDYTFEKGHVSINPRMYYYHSTRFFDNTTRDETGRLQVAHESYLESLIKGFDGQLTHDGREDHTFVAGVSLEQRETEEFFEEFILQYSRVDSVEYVLDSGDTVYVPTGLYELADRYYFSWLNEDLDINSEPGEVTTWNYAAYVQDEMRFMERKLNLTLGLRLDKYEGFDLRRSPRVGLVIHPVRGLTIKNLWGRAFKPPTSRQKYAVRIDGKSPGNPNVGPEKITTFEAAIGYSFENNALIQVNYFNNTLTDFIESINYGSYSNSHDRRTVTGLEVDLRADFRFQRHHLRELSLFSNYSLIDADDKIGPREIPVPSVAEHTANLGIKLQNTWMTLYSGWNFVGRRNSSETYHDSVVLEEYRERDNKGAYLVWDVNLKIHDFVRLPIELGLAVHNLLDKEHYNPTYDPDTYYDYAKERRNVSVKISVEL